MKTCLFLALLFCSGSVLANSVCGGTTANGYVRNAVKLPSKGDNFTSFSKVAELAGRTYVHSQVKNIIVDAYQALQKSHPDKRYKYAETGLENGGKFSPHKTHQNGLSVDFMTPVINEKGLSVHLPTHVFNRFGYDIEFDKQGQFEQFKIDYTALAAHIVELHKSATAKGYDIWRVIFDPTLQAGLYKTKYADYLKEHIQFSTKPSWVRHDEHYHVDFLVPCEK